MFLFFRHLRFLHSLVVLLSSLLLLTAIEGEPTFLRHLRAEVDRFLEIRDAALQKVKEPDTESWLAIERERAKSIDWNNSKWFENVRRLCDSVFASAQVEVRTSLHYSTALNEQLVERMLEIRYVDEPAVFWGAVAKPVVYLDYTKADSLVILAMAARAASEFDSGFRVTIVTDSTGSVQLVATGKRRPTARQAPAGYTPDLAVSQKQDATSVEVDIQPGADATEVYTPHLNLARVQQKHMNYLCGILPTSFGDTILFSTVFPYWSGFMDKAFYRSIERTQAFLAQRLEPTGISRVFLGVRVSLHLLPYIIPFFLASLLLYLCIILHHLQRQMLLLARRDSEEFISELRKLRQLPWIMTIGRAWFWIAGCFSFAVLPLAVSSYFLWSRSAALAIGPLYFDFMNTAVVAYLLAASFGLYGYYRIFRMLFFENALLHLHKDDVVALVEKRFGRNTHSG